MKKLDIKLLENGLLINVLREEVYDNENETLDVFIDYSNTEYNLWDKRCDIVVANGQKSIKLSDTFSLGREYLVEGTLQLQPIAFSGDKVVKFPITSIDVSKSLNVLENDTTVTLSIAQEMLNDIELFKTGVNGELVSQNIKIDGLVLDTDTRLREQDASLELKADKAEVDASLELKADKTYVDSQDLLKADKTYVDNKLSEKANKQQEAWITPTLLNGWETFDKSYNDVSYYKDEMNIVHFRGAIKNGTAQTIFILPLNYRPSKILRIGIIGTTAPNLNILHITPKGEVNTFNNNALVSLENVSFRVDVKYEKNN